MPTYSLLLLPMAMIILDGWARQVHIASTHVSISVFPELMLRGRDINWTGSRQTPFQYNLQCKLRLFLATVMTLKKKIVCIFIPITHNRERERDHEYGTLRVHVHLMSYWIRNSIGARWEAKDHIEHDRELSINQRSTLYCIVVNSWTRSLPIDHLQLLLLDTSSEYA